MDGAEKELESFRERWREEVSQRIKNKSELLGEDTGAAPAPGQSRPRRPSHGYPPISSHQPRAEPVDVEGDFEPRTYHDLENKEDSFRLGVHDLRGDTSSTEPITALEHYEKAVERESAGSLGDSVSLYRRAFKLDHGVHEAYKKKYFPPQSVPTKSTNPNPSNASPTVPNTAHHSPYGRAGQGTLAELMGAFSRVSIEPAPPETDCSRQPPCPIASVPEEILVAIFKVAAVRDVGVLSRLAQVCKRFAYLAVTEDQIWKLLALNPIFGFPAMHYLYACDFQGTSLPSMDRTAPLVRTSITQQVLDLTPKPYPTYRTQFRHHPRIRFNGCYISTVNYQRPGASQASQYTWTSSPIHIVTYYRYMRFFRDGSVISLLSTSEPPDVVHYLTKEHLHERHTGALPSAVMKEALPGRWRLTGAASACLPISEIGDGASAENGLSKQPGAYIREPSDLGDKVEEEGTVHVETRGVIPKYMWKMAFALGSSGRREATRNNRLSWKGFWSYNMLTDDWGEFGLKNDKPFYWSRVKSYGS